jgi:hypothetical protein
MPHGLSTAMAPTALLFGKSADVENVCSIAEPALGKFIARMALDLCEHTI